MHGAQPLRGASVSRSVRWRWMDTSLLRAKEGNKQEETSRDTLPPNPPSHTPPGGQRNCSGSILPTQSPGDSSWGHLAGFFPGALALPPSARGLLGPAGSRREVFPGFMGTASPPPALVHTQDGTGFQASPVPWPFVRPRAVGSAPLPHHRCLLGGWQRPPQPWRSQRPSFCWP